MLSLVLKDFLIQKKYVLAATTLYPLIALLAFNNMQNAILAFGIISIPYILILGAFYTDERSRAYVFMNSLPVRKSDVVRARYITLIICIIAGVVIMSIYIKLADILNLVEGNNLVDIQKILIVVSITTIIYSLEMPFFFKFSMNKMRIISFFVFFLCIVLAGAIGGMLKEPEFVNAINWIITMPSVLIYSILLLITAFIFTISLKASIKFYCNREF